MKMKSMFFLIALLVIVAGCEVDDVTITKAGNQGGSIKLNIAAALDTRTVQPDVKMAIAAYNISGSGPEGTSFDMNGVTSNNVSLTNLAQGDWTIHVFAVNEDNIDIAFGSVPVPVEINKTISATVTVRPIEGKGTFGLELIWPKGSVTEPRIEGTLTSASGTRIALTTELFTFEDKTEETVVETTAKYEDSQLEAGYYTLLVYLYDRDNFVWGAANAVRILAEHTAKAVYRIIPGGNGDIDLSIIPDLQNPVEITFSGNRNKLMVGTNMTVTANTSQAVDTYQWYLNGKPQPGATTNAIEIGSSLAKRNYRLDLVVTKNNIVSSGTVEFDVITPPAEATISLLHFDGLNGGPITDMSGKEWIVTGAAAISDVTTKTGFGQSLYLTGTTYVRTAFSPDFDFKGNDFTIEWWEYRLSSADSMQALQFSAGSSGNMMLVGYSYRGTVQFYAGNSPNSWTIAGGASMGTVKLNQWVHRAVVRNNNHFYTFENGQRISDWSSSLPLGSNCDYVSIGSYNYTSAENMYIDELRISNVARWISNFVPSNQPY